MSVEFRTHFRESFFETFNFQNVNGFWSTAGKVALLVCTVLGIGCIYHFVIAVANNNNNHSSMEREPSPAIIVSPARLELQAMLDTAMEEESSPSIIVPPTRSEVQAMLDKGNGLEISRMLENPAVELNTIDDKGRTVLDYVIQQAQRRMYDTDTQSFLRYVMLIRMIILTDRAYVNVASLDRKIHGATIAQMAEIMEWREEVEFLRQVGG